MKRREFLTSLAVGSLMLKMPGWLRAQATSWPDIALVEGDDPGAITRKALELLGGLKRFVSRGDKVVIKPNIGWDRTPELAACTNPEVVRTLVEMCFEAGAKEVIVTDNSTNAPQRCFPRSGIEAAAKAAGARVLLPNPYRLKKTAIKGVWLKEWEVFTDFLEADKLINVPIAKHHSLSRLTLGMKNWLGALGGARNQLHQRLDEVLVDLAAFFKPVLTVMDAYRILLRNGPQGGRLSDVKLQKMVVAGVDPVAVDSIATTFFGLKPEDLAYLPLAKERGLGEINFERLRLEKENSKGYRFLQISRILSQIIFFSLFLYLLSFTRFTGKDTIGHVEIFFHFDPLLGLTTAVASRVILTAFWLSLITVALTFLLGRVFCGWVCPLGAIHQFFSFLFKKSRLHRPKKTWSK